MEQHIGFFAVYGDITGCAWLDGVWWCGDILSVAVFLARLLGVCLDGGFLSKVGIWNEELVTSLYVSASSRLDPMPLEKPT